ncbi:MAG: DUF1345 domain-containing protein [Hydrogenophaga sp.]|uniref:DUF1345 domain-containing protein n=1 Tax=Hydrogenophaga crocea TaxID=2716225 RepID=A0A6G8ICU1_9BURK|nr:MULTISPECIES: DUF1345 domain-containing protein [Hydrogenophaga]MBL0946446.1 DUF1345 domain-containing protein [Hydrogenophaga sp.]QIM50949.1 DUF1345 domain-containing protein [Hydrogenophaga crocea]
MNLQGLRIVRQVHARPRLFAAAVVGVAVALALPHAITDHAVTRALIGWNAGTLLYVALSSLMMARSTEQHMRRRALQEDEGRFTILGLVVVAGIASLVAVAGQLSLAKDMHGAAKLAHIALAGVTVLSSWAFIQVMFALHYAHDHYAALSRKQPPPLQFPGEAQPVYSDFFYFSAVIGTSGQTADVAFASSALRKIGTVHCILAFLFNTTVLALLINIGASLT